MKCYLACDNGLTGAFALLTGEGKIVHTITMPTQSTRKGNEVDAAEVYRLFKQWSFGVDDLLLVIEEPGGAKSYKAAVSMAASFHAVRAVAACCGMATLRVTPHEWQKSFLKCDPKQTKPVALQKAKSLWPAYDLRENDRCRIPHPGIVDALCIAEWARINHR